MTEQVRTEAKRLNRQDDDKPLKAVASLLFQSVFGLFGAAHHCKEMAEWVNGYFFLSIENGN